MRILSGCFSLLAVVVVLFLCAGLYSATHPAPPHNLGGPPAGFIQPPPGQYGYFYVAPFGGAVRNFFHGVSVVTGWTLGIILFLCVGLPAAFVMLMLALFFFSQHQRERRHREMMDAQFARDRIIDYHTNQSPPI